MLQETVTVDLRSMMREPSTGMKFLVLFLLIVGIATMKKLVRAWAGAPPFRLSRQANNPAYLALLEASVKSLKQWINFTFIGWGIIAATSLYHVSNRLLSERLLVTEMLFTVEDFAGALGATLWMVLFVFLVRWYMLRRIERLTNDETVK